MSRRPKFRDDLVVVEQSYRGEQSFVVKDPETHKYFRFGPLEVMVMQALDGRRTVVEAAEALAEAGLRVSAATVEKFATKLTAMGLCQRTLQERSTLLMERLRAERRHRLKPSFLQGDIFRLRWSLADPDEFLNRWVPRLRFFFTPAFLALSLVLFGIYFVVLALKWSELSGWMSALFRLELGVGTLVLFYATGMVIIAIHELGHGFTCKHFGGEVHEIGAMLLYFEPAFYCNVNDAWTFPDLRARLWVTAAGSWIQLVVASLAAIVWWAAAPGTLASQVALAAVLIGGITTVLINANPLIPLDGYYALSDYLEIPNLRQRAFAHLAWAFKARLLRLELPAPRADPREQRIFLIYGGLAALYIGSMFAVVAATLFGWADRALGLLGVVLFGVGIWLKLRSPLGEWGRTAAAAWRGRGGAFRAWRPWRWAAALAGLLVLGALVPRPITVTGRFAAAPALSVPLTAPDSGIVSRVLVREGTEVTAGTPVAEIRNLELERRAEASRRVLDSLAAREVQARALGRTADAAGIEAARLAEATRQGGMRAQLAGLTLRALAHGVVVTRRPEELTGRWVETGDPVVELGQPDSVELRIALVGAGASLVRPGQAVSGIWHADPTERLAGRIGSVSAAAERDTAAAVEARVRLPALDRWRPGMTGEASVTIRRSNLWGALFWGLRRRIRSDILL